MRSFFRFTFFSTLVFSLFLLSGCKDQPKQAQQAPEAAYIVIQTEQVAVINELSGRLESFRNSDVRARVAGVLEKRLFEEGTDVKQGEKLFIIDPRSYEASVQNARAALARAEANFMQADLKYKRYIPLVEISAVSKQEYDDALAAQKQAAADVASAKAALINAKLDLEYSTVLAPISGRIGRSIVTEGALVGQGEVTLLAVIQQIDPIYLNLTQSSAELLQLQQAMRKGVLKGASEEGLKVTLIMEDGTPYLHPGKLLFSDITVDPSTGEISIRALFPNPDGILLPGMYVRGQLEQAINENAITVPKQAVQRSTEGSTVFVINKDNVAEIRRVQTGASYQEKWVVLDGLNVGDKVIIEGIQKVRPGSPVSPVVWEKEVKPTPATETATVAEKDAAPNEAAEATTPAATETPQTAAKPAGDEKAEATAPIKPEEKTIAPEPVKAAEKPEVAKSADSQKPAPSPQKKAQEKTKPAPVKPADAEKKGETRQAPVTAKPTQAMRTLPAEKAAAQTDNAETAKTAPPDQSTASPAGAQKE